MPASSGGRREDSLRAKNLLRLQDGRKEKSLIGLRASLARIERGACASHDADHFLLGAEELDRRLGGGLRRGALHEIGAPCGADAPAVVGFGLGLALRAAQQKNLIWTRQDFVESEAGMLNGAGLAEFGLDPARLVLARGRDAAAVLRTAAEAARCKNLGAVLVEIFGAPRALDLTASLRLARAAEKSGVTLFLLRIGAGEAARAPPSAAVSRWRVHAQASCALAANAPGAPRFFVTLSRHRDGAAESSWRLEWRRDQAQFELVGDTRASALPGSVSAFSADRTLFASRRRVG